MNNPRNHVYSRIKRLRKESGLSQRQLADKLDITQQQYQIYESGKREMPLFLLIAIADYFQVSLDYLTERVSDRQEEKNNSIIY